MLSPFEDAGIGLILIALAAIGIARAAVFFRRIDTGADRFFSTSFTTVMLVALLIAGMFFLVAAVLSLAEALRIPAAIVALAYTLAVPIAVWRWIGPRPTGIDGEVAT